MSRTLQVGDVQVAEAKLADLCGRYRVGELSLFGSAPNDVYLCVSLTEPFAEDGRCHKLVAGTIKPAL